MNNEKIINESLDTIIGNCFGRYAKYIIQDRALPDIRDGLKPVQRRILYAMYELGLTYEKAYKKSARTVGEVIGKYHPHGDSSIYDAMVRMSQDWKNNIPLLDMHGNNGSIDGDSAAAMRYTECKLSKVSNLMLDKIKHNTVDFVYNFDDSEKEPKILPALLPNLLINGAVGIAAGYATNIPPFNIKEIFDAAILLISKPNASMDEITNIIQGPDFPTGGIIEGKQGILDLLNTGRGKFLISSKVSFNEKDKKINQIIINEIPYDTNKSQIIKELNEIIYEEKISGLIEARDESDKNGINIVIDVKKDKNLETIKNYLFKNTHLQINYAANFVAIVNLKPMLLNIKDAILHYIAHALDIRKKTFIYELNKAEKRYEIIQGLIIAINDIDTVIKIIRQSDSKDDCKNKLIAKYHFTNDQAEAIVVLKLYKLSKTDITDLKHEGALLEKLISELKALIGSEKLQRQSLIKLIHELNQEFSYNRKTKIALHENKIVIDEVDVMEVQDAFLFCSRDGYLKLVTKKIYESNLYPDIGHKNNDFVFYSKKVQTNQNLLIITASGKTLFLPIYKIPFKKWKDVGEHINTFMNLTADDQIVFVETIDKYQDIYELIIATHLGQIKRMNLSEAINIKQIKQSSCLKLKENDKVTNAFLTYKKTAYFVTLLSSSGKGYAFSSYEIPLLQKNSSGVKSIKLKPNEYLINMICSKTQLLKCCIVLNSNIVTCNMDEFNISSRVSAGKNIITLKNEKIINMFMSDQYSLANLLLNDETCKTVSISHFNKKDLNKLTIKDVTYNYAASHGLFEDVSKAKVLPKQTITENDDQLSLTNEDN